MKNNRILILLILLLQGICCAGFAQTDNPCKPKEPQEKPKVIPPQKDKKPIDSVIISSVIPFDPNEIIGLDGYDVPESTDTLRWVSATQTLAYTVYFENDADLAMAAARKVSVTVPLHEKLNFATFGVGNFGFGSYIFEVEGSPSSYQTRIDLRDSLGIFVDVVAGLDIVHNEAFWIFQSIDPATGLPPTAINMGFLPINDSLHSGEGFVSFTVKSKANECVTGDTVTATASIVFDVNEAIPTNTWVNTIDAFAPTSTLTITPNAAGDMLAATFAGEDDEGGCGIKQYKLYYSVNGSSYQLYDVYPVGDTAEIPVETGMEYEFFTLAEDNVGNCEPMKTQPEYNIGTNFVTLAVNAFPQDAGTVTGGGTYTVNDTAQLTATVAEGYHFVSWMSQGVPVSTQNPYSAVVSQNQTYTAYFERIAYTLQTVAADGSVITVTDIYGNEIPSGSTIYHSDRLIVSMDTMSCYQMTSCLLNGNTYAPGDTLTINGDVQIVTQTVSNHDYTEFSEEVCESYTWNGITYIQSSDYTQTFTSTSGCDSVVTLHLTVHHATYGDTTAVACDSFTWYGNTYTSSGSYQSYLTNANGCDSIVTLHLTINHGDYTEVTVDTCGTEFFWEVSGQSYDRSDTYYYYSTNANACQDTNVLVLTLHQAAVTELAAQICEGDTYSQNGFNVSEAGDYEQHLQTVFGCDSTVILHLAVDNEIVTNITVSICEGEDYTDNGFEIIAPEVGLREYSDTIHRQGTCDSIVILTLMVNQATYGDTTVIACNSFDWYGNTYTSSGDYTHTLTNAAGCDSIVTLHLTILPTVTELVEVTACDSYTWNGITYTTSGSYQSYLTNANGCDSVVTLHLTINLSVTEHVEVTACGSYTWNDIVYTESGDYERIFTSTNGCDSIVTLHLTILPTVTEHVEVTACGSYTWNDIVYTESGDYERIFTSTNGCDSIVTMHLTINHGDYAVASVDTCGTEYYWALADTTVSQSGTYYHYSTNANTCTDTAVLMLTLYRSTTTELMAQICAGEVYAQNGFNVSTAGDHYLSLQTMHGCDSVVILHLTVGGVNITNLAASICEGDSYNENGFDIITPAAGIYEYSDTIHRPGTCDSVVILHLTVNATTFGDTTAIVCDSFDWYGNTYTSSGNYTHTLSNAAGCDSIVALHLTILPTVTEHVEVTACGSYTWNDSIYSQSGDYERTFTSSNGCDSTIILHLTVNIPQHQSLTVNSASAYTWNDSTYTVSGVYTFAHEDQNSCIQVDTLHLTIQTTIEEEFYVTSCGSYTWNNSTYMESGDYIQQFVSSNGMDSMVTLHLTIIDLPTLYMIDGEPIVCRNQFSTYTYDISDPNYNYYWYLNSQFLGENYSTVILHEENSGTYTLVMQVEDIQNNCQASTSISVLVQDAYAPDTTVIVRKNNTNILICQGVTSEHGTVHYRWGYTNRFTHEETVLDWDYNYCLFDIGIDQQTYLYWVETYIQNSNGIGCANRTYYGYSIYTDITDYGLNNINARIMGDQLVLHVNATAPDVIDAMLYGINGQLLMTLRYGYTNQVDDIMPFHYSNGMYLLIIRIGNQTYPVKLLKL